ncbi:energy-coupling factor transporter transmembrane protein EcfT [Nocardioides sp. Y6]|uniref:Energy-coupling factor transporter transmembrane protein EcfT n=1 Tax=Nocardioides malaquae TaxID=2773426 RepID=A0ABR9RPC4_9ACTN|nr:energy-coupling factor transporter transmembrane protein EcfT [Nocardioides malaquae]
MLLGSYVPGRSWLHRLPAGAKMLALMLLSTALVLLRGPSPGLVGVAVATVLLGVAGVSVGRTWRALRGLLLAVVLISAWNLLQGNYARAAEQAGDLVAMVLLATVLTSSTRVDDLVAVIVRCLEPFRRFGASPEKVALAFSLVLRTVPILLTLARETREAARARGLERSPRAWLTPFVIRSVAHARDTGDALHARGLGD